MSVKDKSITFPASSRTIIAVAQELKKAHMDELKATLDRAAAFAQKMKPGTSRVFKTRPVRIRVTVTPSKRAH